HISTGYAFNNDMWAKYGAPLSGEAPKEPPKANPNSASLVSLANQGVQFAVCAMATRRLSTEIARAVGANVDAIFAELTANLISNGRMVSAGIVALNRAQARGYSLVRASSRRPPENMKQLIFALVTIGASLAAGQSQVKKST